MMKHIYYQQAQNFNQHRMLRHEVESHLAAEVAQLLDCHKEEGLHWHGTCIDLMEALHTAFLTGLLVDSDGIIIPFQQMVDRACQVLHRNTPRNPYECAARGRRRKGLHSQPYLQRYERCLTQQNNHPLWDLITHGVEKGNG